ncbi:hypothetical protein CYY_003021 [Polysphondylium violaceum]|uniref:Uncharacterized protein n=1 Tax=Polysphondylium violaceum TaxID=133409 RepID=A0A8J4UUN9_9MYCE|nr:hypothetical protein CYY_003021 [Polysphondylium violaceum]
MENIIKINFHNIDSEKELKDAIMDWTDRKMYDESSITRMDILKLLSTHHLEHCSSIGYNPESGYYEIKITLPAKEFYGIESQWHVSMLFPEFGEHLANMVIKRKYDEIKKESFNHFTNDISIA